MPRSGVAGQIERGATLAAIQTAVEGTTAYDYQAISYDNFADYETGLATETAAGWTPIFITNRAPSVGEEVLIVTYRKLQ